MSQADKQSGEAWKADTSAFDRVHSIVETLAEPQPAATIADEALVAENTARQHLERLVDMTVVLKYDDHAPATYGPDPLHARISTLREFLEDYDHSELLDKKTELQTQVDVWSGEYGVESPDELRAKAAETTETAEIREFKKLASSWEHVAYRLSVLDEAIRNYDTYTQQPDPA